jgi:hypothetical protein
MKRSTNGAAFVGFTPAFAALLLTAAQASAQDATVGVGASTAVRPAAAPAAAPVAVANGGSDHDMWIGHVGVGWFGTVDVPVGPVGAAATPALPTPAVGVRYWATPVVGIDVGLGLFTNSGSQNVQPINTTTDDTSRTTFLLHGGIPLALGGSNHFSFQITPELDVGFGSGTVHNPAPLANTDLSGFLLQVGARAGAEVYFGFIGIPQLSLDASVGVFLQSASGKTTTGPNSTKHSTMVIGTSNVASPWDIFRKDIAARYYF